MAQGLPEQAALSPAAEGHWWQGTAPADAGGLTNAQASEALARFGSNSLEDHRQRPLALQFAARLRNPLVLILLGASAISAFGGDAANAAIIMLIVLLSVALDFVQEHRATQAVERLRSSVSLRASVVRDTRVQQIPVAEVVPGDLLLLSAGDRVPADGRVIEARDFFVNQGLLTGESYPIEKRPGSPGADAIELQQAGNAVFMGSTVVSGSARVLVAATGSATALGDVAHRISAEPPPTAFEITTHRFGLMIVRLTLLLVLFVLLVNVLLHRPLIDSFLFAVALAVGLTPELLPMVVSVTLSRGALRMARRRMIVKRLPAIQNLGAMDVLCTDKTGTLTEARIRLERCADADGHDSKRVLVLAHLNSAFESGLRSPLDEAILARDADIGGWRKLDEVPFDFERRRVSVLLGHEEDGARWLVVKGAPEDVLGSCSRYEGDEGRSQAPLDDAARERLCTQYHDLERQGLRVLGVSWRPVPVSHEHADLRDESELIFAGFVAFIDPPKADAAAALAALRDSGVAVKIVTGDSELVTQHLCALLGIPVRDTLTGREIAGMDDAALRARVDRTTLFCRVNPAQKNRIVLALKARGHVVGYLGDGINDAPPLHSADVGLTVDSAVDVAREVADMVMLDHDLAVVHEGVLEGRRTFGNVMKYIMMGTSSNFGNMLSLAGASLFLPFLPLLPAQILLNNALYDLSQAAIPLDRVDARELRKPRALDMPFIRRYMLVFGLISSAFDALTFYVLLRVLHADIAMFRTGWFIESLASQVLVIFIIRTRGNPWKSRPSPALAAASIAVLIIALLLPYLGLNAALGFERLPPTFYGWLAIMLLAYLALVEAAKRIFFRQLDRKLPGRRRRTAARRQPARA